MIACLIPALITGKLHIDTFNKIKKVLEKFVRATCYIAWAGTVPWVMLCIVSRFGLIKKGAFWTETICYSAGMLGIFLEPLSKHTTYVGFYVPKMLECLFNVL